MRAASGSKRATWWRSAHRRRHHLRRPDLRHPRGRAVRAVSLRLLGHDRRRPPPRRQRAHADRLGPGVRAADLQNGRRAAPKGQTWQQSQRAGTHHHGIRSGQWHGARDRGRCGGRGHRNRVDGRLSMELNMAIRELHCSERKLTHHLNVMAAGHHSDQDICHLAQDLASWSRHHLSELAAHGRHYGLHLSAEPHTGALTREVQSRMSGMLRHRPEPGPAAARRFATDTPAGRRSVPGLGVAGPRGAGRQGFRTVEPGVLLPPRDLAPDALGQRHVERAFTQVLMS